MTYATDRKEVGLWHKNEYQQGAGSQVPSALQQRPIPPGGSYEL
jgi:hypothetical protein